MDQKTNETVMTDTSSNLNQDTNTTEFTIHSKECPELATLHKSANRATNLTSVVFTDKRERVLAKLDRQAAKLARKRDMIEAKQKRIAEKQKRIKERIDNMSPNKKKRYEERKQKRLDRINKLNSMTEEDKKTFLDEEREAKEAAKAKRRENKIKRREAKLQKQQDRMDAMSPKRLAKFQKKLQERDLKRQKVRELKTTEKKEFNSLKKSERDAIKAKNAEERAAKRERFRYLNENWTDELPDKVDNLIVDGNNVRGGGPKRHSRDDVISHVNKIAIEKNLTDANIICIFDHKIAKYEKVEHVDVQFSGEKIADDVIVDMVESYGDDSTNVVVTCDRGLALRLLDLGCKVMRNRSFTSILPGLESKYRRGKNNH